MEALQKLESAESQRPLVWFHWQNLNEKKEGTTGAPYYGRCWWHFRSNGKHPDPTVEFCWDLWTHFFMMEFDFDDEGLTLHLGFAPIAFWLSFSSSFWLLRKILPRKPLEYYPDTIVVDERECGICLYDGVLRIKPWCKKNDWHSGDPWYVKGLSFDLNPFRWTFNRHEVRRADRTWVPAAETRFVKGTLVEPEPDNRERETFPYRYVLKNGTIQDRTAEIFVERRAWRPRILRWTGLIEKVSTVIDVNFSDEVGERSGSWKGGCTGCSYELRPGETAEQCLRRMERERKF